MRITDKFSKINGFHGNIQKIIVTNDNP